MKTLALALIASALHAQDYSLGPDSQPQPNVPKGAVTKLRLEPAKFYPGTPHDYSIYVPVQYDPARPAPYLIFLDSCGPLGNRCRGPARGGARVERRRAPEA